METPNNNPIEYQPRTRLADARIALGWSQQKLADQIGTTYVNVSRWERGITRPSPFFRSKLCALYKKSEIELDLAPSSQADSPPTTTHIEVTPYPSQRADSLRPSSERSTEPLTLKSAAIIDRDMPRPSMRLIGRDFEQERIKDMLKNHGSVVLTALNGLPGVGKTALAVALAHDEDIRSYFHDGILWAALGPEPNIPGQLSRWASMLGISAAETAALTSLEDWAKALRGAIASRSMLLVIDDAWKAEDALVFKVGGENCAHLVTTRFRTIAAQVTSEGATEIQELPEKESMDLLQVLAPIAVEMERERVQALVHSVGGLPLALKLIGKYLGKQSHSRQQRRIREALDRLSSARERLQLDDLRAPIDWHPSLTSDELLSLQTVIAVTDEQFDEETRRTLYALSVFPPKPNTFSEEAALYIAQCSVDSIDLLTDSGMLESSGFDRYTLHQVIADYARVHLESLPSYPATHTPHHPLDSHHEPESNGFRSGATSSHITSLSSAAAKQPYLRLIAYTAAYVSAHQKDYDQLEREGSLILATLEAAYELYDAISLAQIITACAPYMLARGLYAVAAQHLARARDLATHHNATATTPINMSGVLLYLGEVAQKQGNYAEAESYYQEGLTAARQAGDQEQVCDLLIGLGRVAFRRGGLPQAEAYLQEGLTAGRQIDDKQRISSFLRLLGSLAASQGAYARSEAYLQEGLAIARQIGDPEQICAMLISLGAGIWRRGDASQSESYYQEGLAIARKIGHREWVCLSLYNLGEAAIKQGNYAQAEAYSQEGLAIAQQIEHREWTSALLANLAEAAREQGKYAEAERYYHQSLDIARQIGRPEMIVNALYEYGNLLLKEQKIDAASECFSEMIVIIPEGAQDMFALERYGRARVFAALGSTEQARRLGEQSAEALESMGHRSAQEVRAWVDSLEGA